jgi:uncharacterized protein YndB with AHSA1/START domain
MADMTSSGATVVTLPTDTQILIEREFNAPRHLVYRAWTIPEHIERWWHAKRGKVTLVEVDLRVGGKWRRVMVTDDGQEVGFHGEYLGLVPNERIVETEFYEGAPPESQGSLNTTTFEEVDGRTALTLLMQLQTREERDAIIESGMEDGLRDALDLLEQVAISLDR